MSHVEQAVEGPCLGRDVAKAGVAELVARTELSGGGEMEEEEELVLDGMRRGSGSLDFVMEIEQESGI
ncbi:hypothetical protein M0R45_016586 [Rubus argutus]|uniref:Uncharacterized protein n=1 Tax=Rubus argutus TaxID=59490 RepID=A0AAW1XU07_RUBAR